MKARYWSASARIEILREIDLLLARQRQQQIERPLEALDIDDQRRLVAGALGELGFERHDVGGHDVITPGAAASRHQLRIRARAAATSKASGARRAAPARHRRARRPRPRATGAAVRDLAHLVEIRRCNEARHRSRPRARPRRARRACPTGPPSRCRRSSAGRRTRSTPRITSLTIIAEVVAGRDRIDGAEHNMCGHPERQAGKRPERCKIGRFQASRDRSSTTGSRCGCRRWRGRARADA